MSNIICLESGIILEHIDPLWLWSKTPLFGVGKICQGSSMTAASLNRL